MATLINIEGVTFGKWEAVSRVGQTSKWNVKCECGTRRVVTGSSLREGRSRSCGCDRKATLALKRGASGADWQALAKREAAQRAAMPRPDGVGVYAAKLRGKLF